MGRVEQMMQARGLNVSGSLSAPANAASKAKVQALHEEQALKTASNTAAAPAAPVSKATTSRGRVSLDPERGYSPGRERARRQYVSLPEPRKTETAPVDYRRAVELNRLNHDLNRLEAQRRQAAVDLDMDALNRVNGDMKRLRAAGGEQTLGDRASDTLSTIFSGSGASYVNTLGTAQELAGAARRRYLPLEIEQKEKELARYLENARCAGDDAERQYWEYEAQRAREALAGYRAGIQESWTQGERLHTLADRMQDDSAKYRESARDGLGKFGSDVVDAGISFGQSLADNAIGAVTGTGMAPFVIRAFGGAAQDARRGGADLDQQLRYGTAQAAKEYITEKLFGLAVPQRLLGKAGTGSLDDAVERGIRNVTERLARTPAGRKVLGGLLTWGAGGATESLEEGIGALIENTLINPNLRAWDPDTRTGQEKFEDGLHDMLVGGLSGLMGVPNLVSYHPNTAQSLSLSTLEDTGAQPGQTAPAAQATPVQRDVLMEAAARGGRLEAETTGHQNTVLEIGDPDMSLVERVRQFIPQMQNMGPVAEVTGTEIPAGGKIVDRLVNFINMIGGKVNRPGFGDVLFSRGRIKSSMLGHGVGPAKIDVFAAVPKVIQSGRQIDFQPNWKGRGYDTYTFMAPINYKGRNYLGVIVTKDAQSSRYYLHEVVDADGNVLFRNDENPASASDGTSALSGDLDTVANAGALNQSPSDGRASHKGTFDTVETLSVGGTRPPVSDITQRSGAVKPQGTDALTQILLDSIKPAERSRPLDVMEREVQRLYGRRDSAVDGGGLQETGGLPAAADIRELYAAAFQNRLVQPGIAQGWLAELEVPALYQEYLRRICGVQPAVPLLPERSGAGREGPADIEGGALVPMLPDTAFPERSGAEPEPLVENPAESDIIRKDILIHKSLGAKAKNYPIYDPSSSKYYFLVEGTRIRNPKVFAGKGGVKPLRPEVAEGLSEQIGGKPSEWQHCKGIGLLDREGEEQEAEIHWFQEPSVGKHRFRVKEWFD